MLLLSIIPFGALFIDFPLTYTIRYFLLLIFYFSVFSLSECPIRMLDPSTKRLISYLLFSLCLLEYVLNFTFRPSGTVMRF